MESIGAILLILGVVLVVAIFVAQPFLNRQTRLVKTEQAEVQERDHLRSALMADRDRVLTALHELDFDNSLGKIPAEEYPFQRAELLKSGANILRRLEALETSVGQSGGENQLAGTTVSDSMEARIEAAVKARRADGSASGVTGAAAAVESHAEPGVGRPERALGSTNGGAAAKDKDELEELIASRKRMRKESAAGFCPNCGRPVQKSDKFCARCGAVL